MRKRNKASALFSSFETRLGKVKVAFYYLSPFTQIKNPNWNQNQSQVRELEGAAILLRQSREEPSNADL